MKFRARGIARAAISSLLPRTKQWASVGQSQEQEVKLCLTLLGTIRRQEVTLGLVPPAPSDVEARKPWL